MASPILSHSPSATFAPGPHRRSHPNLHHLSLAPLTPKYPIDPSDYDAYFDPSTSELHSSASLSHIAALPSPGGILTNSPARSRASSRTRLKKKAKSSVTIRAPSTDTSQHADNDDAATTDHKTTSKPTKSQQSLPRLRTTPALDETWLVQTGLTLSESSRESKGQSWISKRDSSTALANIDSHSHLDPRLEGRTPRSGRATPARSRVGSRNTSRNASRSRLNLSMTMTGAGTSATTPGASFATAPDHNAGIREEDEPGSSYSSVEPNWSDARTQAEIAAQVQAEFGEDYEYDNNDPYGMLNFEGQGDDSGSSDAEEEVKRAMTRYGIGGWMDGAIDALLRIEEENDPGQRREQDLERGKGDDGGERRRISREMAFGEVETPPEQNAQGQWRIWNDIAWFGRMVSRSVNEG
ncbi:hypothetical protein H2198_003878 [Neophaeococcomyces mojaviensis]|uniref:Uncharacterized protein n=1 Tax=Neophaeococcomyces mojaviensis TaxID=3383035 RepID=A0ACC3AAH6_9EURO|nr:hypothetical protein H2198_003878 [Knufia sp. JES_112]